MNASKALGKEVELPDSLKKIIERSKTSEEDRQSGKSRSSSSSSSGSGAASQERVEAVKEQMETNHRSPYMLWCPVTSETKSFSKSLSPKEAYKSRAR